MRQDPNTTSTASFTDVTPQPTTATTALAKDIQTLDLGRIGTKLMAQGMSAAEAAAALQQYREFLHLSRAYPDAQLVPTETIDAAWHLHILDTRNYAADCTKIFGEFLHHSPQTEAGAPNAEAIEQTRQLWLETFNDAPFEDAAARCTKAARGTKTARCTKAARCTKTARCTK